MFALSQRHRLRKRVQQFLWWFSRFDSFAFLRFSYLSSFFSFSLLFFVLFFCFFYFFFLFYFFLFFLFIYLFIYFFLISFFRQKVCRSRQFSGSYRLYYERHVFFFLMVHHPATIRNRRLLVWCHIKSLRRSRTHKIWMDVIRSICLSFWCSIRAALVIMLLEGS